MLLENKTAKNPIAEEDVVINLSKKLRGSLETYPKGHEQFLKIEQELEILKGYMPKELSEDEVKDIICGTRFSNAVFRQRLCT